MTGSIQDLKTDGAFFKYLNKKNEYKQQVRETMVRTAAKLTSSVTSEQRPGDAFRKSAVWENPYFYRGYGVDVR